MRNKMKYLTLAAVACIAASSVFAGSSVKASELTTVSEEAPVFEAASGTWGALDWSISGSTLKISGSGSMTSAYYNKYPWYQYSSSITTVEIGDYVSNIASDAFYNFSTLSSVKIGSRVTTIDESAFQGCQLLKSVTIPASVITIDEKAFYGDKNLKTVSFAEGSKLATIDHQAFRGCSTLGSITFPSGLLSLGTSVFYDCSNLSLVKCNDKLSNIGNYAFYNCTSLRTITLGKDLKNIGNSSFEGCISLPSVNLPYGLVSIGEKAFSECTLLSGSVKIPGTVTALGYRTFYNCKSLTKAEIYCACDIPTSCFYKCISLAEVKIGGTVTGIGNYAFENCTALKSVSIPSSVSGIGASAFSGDKGLESLTLNEGLTSIGSAAFYQTSISSVKIPNTVSTVDHSAFRECKLLKSAVVGNSLTVIASNMFRECPLLSKVTLGESVVTIGSYAFDECSALTSISLPVGVTSIEGDAFRNTGLTSFTGSVSLTSVGSDAFQNCENLKKVIFQAQTVTISTYAFEGASALTDVYIFSAINPFSGGIYTAYGDSMFTIHGLKTNTLLKNYCDENNYPFRAIGALSTPEVVKSVTTVDGAHIYWKRVNGALRYDVYRSESENGTYKLIGKTTAVNYVDKTLASGKTYYFKIVAANGSVGSGKSAALKCAYVATPDITGRANKSTGIQLTWNKITGATGYALYRKTTGDWARIATISGNSTFTYLDTSVANANGTEYHYTVRAVASNGALSGCRTTGRTMVRISTPTLTSVVKASAYSAKCTWSKNDKATGYEVRFMDGSTVVKTVNLKGSTTVVKTVTELTTGKTYKVQVRAYVETKSAGTYYSSWSAAKNVTLK